MSGEKLKQGYLQKYAKGLVSDSWPKVYVELYKDSQFVWYKKKNDKNNKGNVPLKSVCEFLTVGSYCRAIPYSPEVPAGSSLENMIAFPQEPSKKSKIHFFLCSSQQEFNEWMSAIGSTLPAKPQSQDREAPIVATAAHNAFSPPPAGAPSSVAGIGFESLSISGQPPPYSAPPVSGPQHGYPPHAQQSYPQQPYPPQSYPPQPYSQHQYAHQPYPQQPYPQQPYPQQPYPQQQGYPGQQYPQQPYQQPPYMHPQQQVQRYAAPSTTVIYQNPQPQTVVIRDNRSHGMGNLAAGLLGGAVGGYCASRMYGGYGYGGYGYGLGWGGGSWGSCSWGSRSWGSCSGGSWGSFGGFD